MQSKKFSRCFYDLEDVVNFCFENDFYKVVEYKDDLKSPFFTRRATRVGLVSGDTVIWDNWEDPYTDMDLVRSVYRVRTDRKLDNAFAGIV